MRLLCLSADPGVPVLGHKGASVHLREMVTAFAAAGAEVLVASPRVRPEGDELEASAELLEIAPVRAEECPSLPALRQAMTAQAQQVEQIARAKSVDAVYERLSLFGLSGVRTAQRLDVPHVLEVNAPLCDEARRFRTLPYPQEAFEVERRVCRETDHVFANSEATTAHLVDAGVSPAKVAVVPNGVDVRKFTGRRRRRGSGVFRVGFLGSLNPWHGIDVLLEAFTHALARRTDLRLEIVGAGPEANRLAEAALPADAFLSHGPLAHRTAIEVMSQWDVGVAPFLPLLRFYFSPLKVVEYMAAGVCPVASDLGQIRTLLDRGKRGVLVEPGNAGALAGAILGLASDRPAASELGARARAYALRELTWQKNAERALSALTACKELAI
jgi:glycosyltransferase involved in cell wall biosynthesis